MSSRESAAEAAFRLAILSSGKRLTAFSNNSINSKNLEEVLDTVGDIMKGVNSINKGFSGRGGNFGGGGASGGW